MRIAPLRRMGTAHPRRSATDDYWQTPTTPVPAGPVGVVHVPVITTLPTVPLQHGVPPPMQLRPLGRQQLHLTLLPDLSTLQFPQQAPSVDRQWPLLVWK